MAAMVMQATASKSDGKTAGQCPVDLVHLARHTLGNRELEQEILRLFCRQSEMLMVKMENAESSEELFAYAHTMKGSARGIGAWDVANLAEIVEAGGSDQDIGELNQAVRGTVRFIGSLLDVH